MAKTAIEKEITRVLAQGGLGRSTVYGRLLRYLADASERGTLPKEIDIASDVLDKQQFEPGSDSTVRVYVHNLRQKLNTFYESDTSNRTARLLIPKGKYQLILSPDNMVADAPRQRTNRPGWKSMLGLFALVSIAFILGRLVDPGLESDRDNDYANTPVWQAIVNSDKSVLVVVGDYYMFAEGSSYYPGERLIRDFSINSTDDFEQWIDDNPDLADKFMDIRLSYLPVGIATALNDVLRVLHQQPRTVRILPQSQFHPRMLRNSHVVYVGYVSGLGSLSQYLFAASRLALGNSYDEVIDVESGEHFVSSAGVVTDDASSYTDYGFVSTFPGPSDNQFLFITGMRDEGLMRMAATLADPGAATSLGSGMQMGDSAAPSFEALYRVSGIDRTHVAAQRLFTSPVDARQIWLQ